MHKKFLSAALALLLALALAGCASQNPPAPSASAPASAQAGQSAPSSPSASPSAQPSPAAKPDKDREGNAITLPESVNTIVSMAPATTQVLCDLGLADKIVAVDTQSPLYAVGLAEGIPTFDMMSPDAEAIAALKPDLVFTSGLSAVGGDDPFAVTKQLGVCVANIPSSDSIQGVQADVQFIADCVGKSQEGRALVERMQDKIDQITAIGKTIDQPAGVLFEIAAAPQIYSFGSGVFLDEMITLIGAKNVMAGQTSWVSVSEEDAVAANPDVILTNVNYLDDAVAEIKARPGWENVAAVKDGRVFYIDNGASSLPNHHIVDALVQMAQAVYPEAYKEIS